ncbi:MAG: circadian clock KaiB family protein [Sporichthyaceae bacterium]
MAGNCGAVPRRDLRPSTTLLSIRAIANLRRICEAHLAGRHQIEVVDLTEHPEIAREQEIVALPTVVRRHPEPVRAIVGDLTDTARVLAGLGLRPPDGAPASSTSPVLPRPRASSPITTAPPSPAHHRIERAPHLGRPTGRGGGILIAGTTTAALWGVMVGNLARGTDLLARPLADYFDVTNGFAVGGAASGAGLFLISAGRASIRKR